MKRLDKHIEMAELTLKVATLNNNGGGGCEQMIGALDALQKLRDALMAGEDVAPEEITYYVVRHKVRWLYKKIGVWHRAKLSAKMPDVKFFEIVEFLKGTREKILKTFLDKYGDEWKINTRTLDEKQPIIKVFSGERFTLSEETLFGKDL